MANENKKTFLDFLKILTKWRRSLLLNFVLVVVISVIISLLLPKWYKASSLVMAPQTGASSMGGLSALMSNLPLGGLGLSAGSGNEMVYMGILKSRTIADSVIDKYNLQEYYENASTAQTIESQLAGIFIETDLFALFSGERLNQFFTRIYTKSKSCLVFVADDELLYLKLMSRISQYAFRNISTIEIKQVV